jgi:hypothetical protein
MSDEIPEKRDVAGVRNGDLYLAARRRDFPEPGENRVRIR